jgi:phage terminase small subunit
VTKLNEQQERFCRAIVEGMNQRDAYVAAGYKTTTAGATDAAASRLLSDVKIAARLAELRQPIANRFEITTDFLATELLNVWKASIGADDRTNARQALMDIAKLTGRIVDMSRVQAENVNYNLSADPLPAEEWEREFGDANALGAAAGSTARAH